MKLKDLKTGDLVKTKDFIGIIFTDEKIVVDIIRGDFLNLSEFNDNLECKFVENYNILAIYKPIYRGDSIRAVRDYIRYKKEPNWTWKKDEYILDKEERRYLRNIIRPFKEKVLCIRKEKRLDLSFIRIECTENETINLPFFKTGDYYKNMLDDKNYTIQDLKLFD